ncbi:hypothetical protein Tco_0155385 [Tanacetum coccineum]
MGDFDRWGFKFKEVSHLGEELRPNEVEKGRILEAHRLEPILQQQLSQCMAPSHHDEKLQDDCDIQATNIVLQDLPPDVYSLVNHFQAAKDIWDRVKLLMQGTKLSYQEREGKLYNEFDKFTSVKGESLYEYYLRFDQLINDMHIIGMTMQQVHVNTKFLNALQPKWSKFVTNVKLAKNMYNTNYDQLYVYLSQHEGHANEVRMLCERYPDPLALIDN